MEVYRILLVEDDEFDVELARKRLEGAPPHRFHLEHAPTLAAALTLLKREPLDAILLDLNLPDSRGLQTLLRIHAASGNVPILVLSGDHRITAVALEKGAEDVIDKADVSGRLLSRSLLYLIERNRARGRRADLERLLGTTPDAILVVNREGRVRYVNNAALELFDRPMDDLLGETLGFSVRDGEPIEISIAVRGSVRICEMRVVPIEWDREHAHLAAIRDITERIHAEELRQRSLDLAQENRRIQEANRLKDEFLANMSHELRTPLNAIIGFSQLLHSGRIDRNAPEHDEFLGDILTSGRHLLQLINDVLDLAKIEAGKIQFSPRVVVIAELCGEVVTILRGMAAEKGVCIEQELDPEVETVVLDPARIRQVLYNYLANALKFTPSGGRVTVRVRGEGEERFRIEVEDNGEGIAAEDLDRLFVAFQQLEAGMAKRHQGTGLGLALTRRIVEAQGGRVDVQSELGRGSVFSAVLPRHTQADG